MDNHQLRNVRRLVLAAERLCSEALRASSLSSIRANEQMVHTLTGFTTQEWAKLSLLAAIPPCSPMERRRTIAVFEARARILREGGELRYVVTYFDGQSVATRPFRDPIAACEFAAGQTLDGAPAPVDLLRQRASSSTRPDA